MRTGLVCVFGILAGAMSVPAQNCTLPGKPEPLTVQLGISGRPPSFIYGALPLGAKQVQIQVWYNYPTGNVANVWVEPSTAFISPITVNGKARTEVFLRGPSQTGFMLFQQAGSYQARWRGYNDCGYGPWSEFTKYKRAFTTKPTTTIVRGLTRVSSGANVMFVWTNNFADEVYSAVILYGGRAVRSEYGRGSFRAGWIYQGSNTYKDRPASPELELPNADIYSFRVRAWAPINRCWSPWTTNKFVVARSLPELPVLSVSQSDFNGFFNLSPRPRFIAQYKLGVIPALWTYFDIRRLENGRLVPVFQKWVSRYTLAENGAGRGANQSEICLRGEKAMPDLPPGTYVWRVKAHNGHNQWWDGSRKVNLSRWSAFRTNLLVAAGALAQPPTNGFFLGNRNVFTPGSWYAKDPVNKPEYLYWSNNLWRSHGQIGWDAVPNAFVYNIKIYRSNQWFKSYFQLDPRLHASVIHPSGRSFLFTQEPFPAGTYRFMVQAVNRANPTNLQFSPWSALSRDFTVP